MDIEKYGTYNNLIFDDFPPVIGKPIILLRNFLFFRGHSKKEKVLSSNPKFFGHLDVAYSYSKGDDKQLGCFTNTEEIRLIDIRYLRLILQPILSSCDPNKYEEIVAKTMLAIGIGSYNTQVKIARVVFKNSPEKIERMIDFQNELNCGLKIKGLNPIEANAFRIAETNLDSYVFLFLKELLEKYCDGIISPKLYSPFHTEKTNNMNTQEILLFNPKKSGLKPVVDFTKKYRMNYSILSLIGLENKKDFKPYSNKDFFIQFGGENEDRNYIFNDKEKVKEIQKQFKNVSKDFQINDFFVVETYDQKRSRFGIVPWCKELGSYTKGQYMV